MTDTLRNALHAISLCSQNSMSSKEDCGRLAREALTEQAASLVMTRDELIAAAESIGMRFPVKWQPIESAPNDRREMFVARAFDVTGEFSDGRSYTTDPWCVWREPDGGFARWPHSFPPTHWLAVPKDLQSVISDPPSEVDVRRILLDVVPGEHGDGEEVYARTVKDVEAKLTELGERVEELQATQPVYLPIPGAVWGLYNEPGVSLIQAGTEDERIAKRGGQRIYIKCKKP